jgi:hypothetical protein
MCGRTPGNAGSCYSQDVPAVTLAPAMTKDPSFWSGSVGRLPLPVGPLHPYLYGMSRYVASLAVHAWFAVFSRHED